MSSNRFNLLFPSLLRVSIEQRQRPSRQDVDVTNVSILRHLKMGPVLATEGESRQTKMYTHCRWCVKANGAGVRASNDWKWTNDGAIG